MLKKLSAAIYRRPHEFERLTNPGVLASRWALFFAFAFLLVGIVAVGVSRTMLRWTSLAAAQPVELSEWRVYYGPSPGACPAKGLAQGDCLASVDNPKLWTSPFGRGDQRTHFNHLIEDRRREYWLGLTLPPARLETAYEREANFYILGNLRCNSFRIWVNGEPALAGNWLDSEPIVLQLPSGALRQGKPLRLAASCVPEPGVGLVGMDVPDFLEAAPIAGLATKAQATFWRTHAYFWLMARPLMFAALNFALALLFISVWRVAPEKAEYFYFALLALGFSLVQARQTGLVYLGVNRSTLISVQLIINIELSFAGMLVGFSFARLRNAIISVTTFLLVGTCAISPFIEMYTKAELALWISQWALPIGLLVGALACVLQALALRVASGKRERADSPLDSRRRRLWLFAGGLAIMASLNWLPLYGAKPSLFQMLFSRSGPFFLLTSLGFVAITELRAEHRLAQSMPVSPFHLLEPLPEQVAGALLSVDLKQSERMFREGARRGRAGELVETCLSHLWAAVSEHRGVVLSTEGDALRALFPADQMGDPTAAAIEAVREIRRSLGELEQRFRSQVGPSAAGGVARFLEDGIQFRASLVEGAVRPVWQSYGGGARLAAWTEAGSSNAFVDGSRLLELERELPESAPGRSLLVLPAALGARLDPATLAVRSRSITGKHGQRFDVAAIVV